MRLSDSTLATIVLGGGIFLASSGSIQAQTTYLGEGAVAKADIAGVTNVSLSDTGQLAPSGGSLAVSLLDFSLPPTLDLHLLTANTVGENDQTQSQAAVTDVTLNVVGILVTASVLSSTATAACFPDHAEVGGSSTLVALKVNGRSVKATGKPNQTVPLLVGSLVINEQIGTVTGAPSAISGDILVNALHLKVDLLADVAISSSHAGVLCSTRGGRQ